MKTKLLLVVNMLLIMAFVLSACGAAATPVPAPAAPAQPADKPAEAKPTDAPKPTDAAKPTEAPAAPAEPAATLVMWVDAVKAPIFKQVTDQFLVKYNVKVDIQITDFGQIRDKFQTAAPTGNGPDIIIVPHDQVGVLVSNGLVAPIDLGDKQAAFLQPALDAFTIDGKLYGMPYAVENVALFYNKDLVTDLPKTWEDLMAAGKKLQDDKKATYCLGFGSSDYHLFSVYTSFGGYIFGKDANGNYNPQDVGLDGEGFIKAVQFLAENVRNGCLSSTVDGNTSLKLFTDGQEPFMIGGPWDLDAIKTSKIPYGMTTFPGNGAPFSGIQGFMLNAKSQNLLLAQSFLTEYIATDEVMTQLQTGGSRPSAYQPVFAKISDPDMLAFGQAGANPQPMPAIPAMGAVWANWGTAITLVFQGKQAPEAALKDAAKKIRDVIANPLTGMVNVPGSDQNQLGCGDGDAGNWKPDCAATALKKSDDGQAYISGPFNLKAGDYEVKVALNGAWTTNYGVDGKAGGDNIKFSLKADGEVSFSWDPESHLLTVTTK